MGILFLEKQCSQPQLRWLKDKRFPFFFYLFIFLFSEKTNSFLGTIFAVLKFFCDWSCVVEGGFCPFYPSGCVLGLLFCINAGNTWNISQHIAVCLGRTSHSWRWYKATYLVLILGFCKLIMKWMQGLFLGLCAGILLSALYNSIRNLIQAKSQFGKVKWYFKIELSLDFGPQKCSRIMIQLFYSSSRSVLRFRVSLNEEVGFSRLTIRGTQYRG